MRRFLSSLFSLVFLLALASCATVPSAPSALSSSDDLPFALEGRFTSSVGDHAAAGKLDWRHAPSRDEMTVATPLGTRVLSIERDGETLTIQRGENDAETYRGENWKRALRARLGFSIPIDSLAWWVRGIADPSLPISKIQKDSWGRLSVLEQDDWELQFDYSDETSRLPRRVFADDGADASFKLVIDSWEKN